MIRIIVLLGYLLWLAAAVDAQSVKVSILVDLDPTSAERTMIVESITADRDGRLYVPDRVSGNILRVDPKAPKPVVVARIGARQKDGKTIPAEGAGIAFNAQGDLFIASGSFGEVVRIRKSDLNPERPGVAETFATGTEGANGIGAIWKVEIGGDGKGGKAILLAQNPLLEGADGIAFDSSGKLWVAANERNAILTVNTDGTVQEVAKNGSQGPLEFPSAIVFVGNTGYISNYDTPRRDNMAADGKTSIDGIGASIAQIMP